MADRNEVAIGAVRRIREQIERLELDLRKAVEEALPAGTLNASIPRGLGRVDGTILDHGSYVPGHPMQIKIRTHTGKDVNVDTARWFGEQWQRQDEEKGE